MLWCWPGTGSEGRPLQGEGSLLLGLQLPPGTCNLCIWCSNLRISLWGKKPCPQPRPSSPVLGGPEGCRLGGEEGSLVRQLPCPLRTLPAPGFRVGAKEKTRLSVSPASLPSHRKMSPVVQPPLLESLPPLRCLTSHIQIHLVGGTVGVDGAQRVFPSLVTVSSGSTKDER